MTKRSIQTSAPGYSVGIEFDSRSVRGARVSSDGRGGFALATTSELKGDFAQDAELIEALRKLKSTLGMNPRDAILSCLSGKQVFATQMDFRKLTGDEMEQALRLELRKIVHFEVATSSLDFEILDGDGDSTGGQCQLVVAMAANSVLSRHLNVLERSGMRPAALDVLPLTVGNALWAWRGDSGMETPCAALHVGHGVCTFVIDGQYTPYFNRYIPFASDEAGEESGGGQDKAKPFLYLAEEVSRSIAFHEKTSGVSGVRELILMGDALDESLFADALNRRTGLSLSRMDLAAKFGGPKDGPGRFRFDLAMALALRGDA